MNDSIASDSMAYAALADVDALAAKLGEAESLLEEGYAQFAAALLEVQNNRYWQLVEIHGEPCPSWGAYIADITEKFKMGRAQLYHKVAVVRQLQGVVDAADLTNMGISKASVLADIHRATGTLPDGAVSQAKDSATVKDLRKALAEASHMAADELGEWYDVGFAFVVTAEERATLQEAERAARQLDPPISNSLKTFQQKKEVALRWAQEFLATYPTKEDENGAEAGF